MCWCSLMDSLWRQFVLNSERENRVFLYIFRLEWTFAESNLEAGFNFLFCPKLNVWSFHGCFYRVEFCPLSRAIKAEFGLWHQYIRYFLMMNDYFARAKVEREQTKKKTSQNRYSWLVLVLHILLYHDETFHLGFWGKNN